MNKVNELGQELEELFDIRSAKIRNEKTLNSEAMASQRDIRLLTHMFRDEVPDLSYLISNEETVRWDSERKRLLLISEGEEVLLEAAGRETMIRIRPFLSQLVKAAKEFYSS